MIVEKRCGGWPRDCCGDNWGDQVFGFARLLLIIFDINCIILLRDESDESGCHETRSSGHCLPQYSGSDPITTYTTWFFEGGM